MSTEFSKSFGGRKYISVTRCRRAMRITIMHALVTRTRAYLKRVSRRRAMQP